MDILKTITVGGVQYDIAPKASYDTFGAVRIGTGLKVGVQGNDDGTILVAPDLGWVVGRGLGLLPPGCKTTYDPFLGRETSGFATCIGTKVIFSEYTNESHFGTVVERVLEACNKKSSRIRPDLLIGVVQEMPTAGPGTVPIDIDTLSLFNYPITTIVSDSIWLHSEALIESLTIKLNWLPGIVDVEAACCEAHVCCTTSTMIYKWNVNGIHVPEPNMIYWGSLASNITSNIIGTFFTK